MHSALNTRKAVMPADVASELSDVAKNFQQTQADADPDLERLTEAVRKLDERKEGISPAERQSQRAALQAKIAAHDGAKHKARLAKLAEEHARLIPIAAKAVSDLGFTAPVHVTIRAQNAETDHAHSDRVRSRRAYSISIAPELQDPGEV